MSGPDPSPVSPPENDDPSSTVELVGFGPSSTMEGTPQPSLADAATYARRMRTRWILISVALILLAAIVLGGPSVVRHLKALRADQLARVAEDHVAHQRLAEAMATSRTAFMLSPGEPEVTRAVARTLSSLQVPGAMAYWHWLIVPGQGTDEDRRDAAEYCLQQHDFASAMPVISDLLRRTPKFAPNLLLAARFCALTGDQQRALALANQAQAVDPASEPVGIFIDLEKMDNPYLRQEGIDGLFRISDSDDTYGLLSMQRLAEEPNLTSAERDRLIARLKAHPLAGEAQRLTALGMEIGQNPGRRERLIDEAMTRHAHAPMTDRRDFARWLVTMQEPDRVLKLVTLDEALGNQDLFSAYLDAMSQLGQWAQLRQVLLDQRVPLEEPLVQLYLSRCERELGDAKAEELYWRSAEIAAAHNPKVELALASYAEQEGAEQRAAAIYRMLTLEPLVARVAFDGLLRVTGADGTAAQRDILDQMAARYTDDLSVQGGDIYFNLLLKARMDEMASRLARLMQGSSADLTLRTDLALIELRLQKPGDALAIFRQTPMDWTKAPLPTLIVYAATLEANGRHREARRILVPVDLDKLRPEERSLVRGIRS